jgi:endonuclease YncB( thermonuclease family)
MKPSCSAANYSALWKHIFTALVVGAQMQSIPASAAPPPAIEIQGKIERVVDGDTVVFLSATGQRIRLRLAGIDAPEMAMPYGGLAKNMLIQLVGASDVTVHATKLDRFGRAIAKVIAKDGDVNLALINQGLAWHYKRYAHEQTASDADAYAQTENEAKAREAGLWKETRPVPPWAYRACRKKSSTCRHAGTDSDIQQEMGIFR